MNEQEAAETMKAFSESAPSAPKTSKPPKGKAEASRGPQLNAAAAAALKEAKEEKDALEKAALIRKIQEYLKLIRKYHPEKEEFIKVPKNFGLRTPLPELKVVLDDIQAELSRSSAVDSMKWIWMEGFSQWEKLNEGERFGMKMNGIGMAARNAVLSRQMPDGTIIPGPSVPLLEEFVIEYPGLFQSSVKFRLAQEVIQMIVAVHRMNASMDVQRAATTQASEKSEDLMKDL